MSAGATLAPRARVPGAACRPLRGVALLSLLAHVAGCATPAGPTPPVTTSAAPPVVPPAPLARSERLDEVDRPLPAPAPTVMRSDSRQVLATPPPSPAAAGGGPIRLSLVNADLREIVRVVMGEILRLNYTIHPEVAGTATLDLGRGISRAQLLPALQALLRAHGAAIVPDRGVYLVVPAEGRGSASLIGSDFVGSTAVPLQHASAPQLADALKPLVGDDAQVVADPERNVLVVTGSDVARRNVGQLIALFDAQALSGQSYAIIPVGSVPPAEAAAALDQYFGPRRGAGPRVVPVNFADAVLVISPTPSHIDRATAFLANLSGFEQRNRRKLWIYRVQYAQPAELAGLLQAMFAPDEAAPAGDAAEGLSPIAPGVAVDEVEVPGVAEAGGLAPAADAGVRTTTRGLERASEGDAVFEEAFPASAATPAPPLAAATGVRIRADERRNALIIRATAAEYQEIEAVLAKLDVSAPQVLIEATIAEVTLNDNLRYGTQFFLRSDEGIAVLTEALSDPVIGSGPDALPNDILFPGTLQPEFPGFALARTVGDVQVVIQALETVTDVRIVSSPQLLILDKEVARLEVGDDVPIITQSATSVLTADATLVNNVDYRDTGVILTVRPSIGAGDSVMLDLQQEVSSVRPTTSSPIDSPTFQQRRVRSRVTIESGQTIGLAGLIRDSQTESDSGVPLLKDIPVLGFLFSTKRNLRERTELLVLIKSTVVRNRSQLDGLTRELRLRLAEANRQSVIAGTVEPVAGAPAPQGPTR